MSNSNALRMWGLSIFALTVCLLALLIDGQVAGKQSSITTDTAVTSTTTTESTTTTTTIAVDLSWLNTMNVRTHQTSAPAETVDVNAFFECVKWRESRGNYQAVNPTGTFMGAYQFYQGGWDTFAARIGRDDLVGVPPNMAAPADQDAVALAAYNELGAKPWGGACA